MKRIILTLIAMVTLAAGAYLGCGNGNNGGGFVGGFVTTIQGQLLDGNGDPIGGATLWIPCKGNICGNVVSRLNSPRNENHVTTCDTPPNDGNVTDGNDWFVATCTDDDDDTDDTIAVGEFHGLSCPPGTTTATITANIILPQAGFGGAIDTFEFHCLDETGDIKVPEVPSP